MADVKDLIGIGEDLVPRIVELAKKDEGEEASDAERRALADLTASLRKVVTDDSVAGKVTDLAAALVAAQRAIYAAMRIELAPTKRLILRTQEQSVMSALGRLAQRTALAPLGQLLSPDELHEITQAIEGATREIAQRRLAKQILDTTIDVLVILASVAVKLA